MTNRKKIYLVETAPGEHREFNSWPACQAFVKGKSVAFGSGFTREEALEKVARSRAYLEKGGGSKHKPVAKAAAGPRPTEGICSDAGTHGNPGPCEYQVCDLKGRVLEHKHLGVHTNNYAELAGIGAMLRYAAEHDIEKCWTDSQIAIGWIDSGRLGPTVRERDVIMTMVKEIQGILSKNPKLNLLKWHTKKWGEIPADFGRK
jgi:ribonuclease HI